MAQVLHMQVRAKMVRNGLHRLYIVDEEVKPIGIVTLTDILRTVVENAK